MVLGEISSTTVTIVDNDGMNYSCSYYYTTCLKKIFLGFVGIAIGFTQARHRESEGTGGVPVHCKKKRVALTQLGLSQLQVHYQTMCIQADQIHR